MGKETETFVLIIRKHPTWLSLAYETMGEEFGDQCERIDDEIRERERVNQKYYYEVEYPKVIENVRLLREDMKEFAEECRNRRKSELQKLSEQAKLKLTRLMEHRGEIERKKQLLKSIKKIDGILHSEITDGQIDQARQYPLERLLEIKNGMAKCINHDDSNPSMNCRNNYVYCHACGYHDNAIGVYMKTRNCNFVQAIKEMTL